MSNIFVTIPDKLFAITPILYKLPCFEVRPVELGFNGVSRGESGEGEMVRDTGFESEG
jgi:hypothetical protein